MAGRNSALAASGTWRSGHQAIQFGDMNITLAALLLTAPIFTVASFLATDSWFLDEKYEDEPSDQDVLSAIASSVAKYKARKKTETTRNKRSIPRAVCYKSIGCFKSDGPYTHLEAPAPPEAIGTRFLLYTRRNPVNPDILSIDNMTSIYHSNYNASMPSVMIIHGFGSSGTKHWVHRMSEALLYVSNGDKNVLIVDWAAGAAMPNYLQAVANTRLVARQTAKLINMLGNPSNIHIVGFSLGAHIAGFVGQEVNITRITGLDPAGPLFENSHHLSRLDPNDADFVDIIHTNGNGFLGLGAYQQMGHYDFYINGGKLQRGCTTNVLVGAISDIFYGKWQSLCNHRRAINLFVESMHPMCKFPAFVCEDFETFVRGECFPCKNRDDCGLMGYYSTKRHNRPQKLFLLTRNQAPFCANQFKIKLSFPNGFGSTYGQLAFTLIADEHGRKYNETFVITEESQEITDKQTLKGIIVAHPLLENFTEINFNYNAYKGWIYSGKNEWGIKTFLLISSNGKTFSFCGPATIRDNITLAIPLKAGDCTVAQRVPRLVWEVIEAPQLGQPPRMVWKIALDDVYPNGHRITN